MEDKKIPVLSEDLNNIHWIPLSDICYCALDGKSITYYTKDTVYYHIRTLEELATSFKPEGFDKLDRVNLVQIDNITFYDSEFGKVYFDDVIDTHSLYATVSSNYMRKIKQKLGPDKDIANK